MTNMFKFVRVNAEGESSPVPSDNFEYNINKISPRIVNIDRNVDHE